MDYELNIVCATCKGTGVDPADGSDCSDCNQSGFELKGNIPQLGDDINWLKTHIKKIEKKLNMPESLEDAKEEVEV